MNVLGGCADVDRILPRRDLPGLGGDIPVADVLVRDRERQLVRRLAPGAARRVPELLR